MDTLIAGDSMTFEDWRFDRRTKQLFRRNAAGGWGSVALGGRALEILSVLLERPGSLVSRDAILDAVWPKIAVEPNNLTVQITALRRILDDGRTGVSCIQTVPGRGYRFALPVTPLDQALASSVQGTGVDPPAPLASIAFTKAPRRRWTWLAVGLAGIVTALALVIAWHGGWPFGTPAPPRLSLVVLPFENLGGDPRDDYLAEGITDDLTTDLSQIPGSFVIARESAHTYKGKSEDVRKIGEELGVRYVLEGSVRRMETILRVNVELTSTETGAHLWSDRFDEQIADLAAGQEQIVSRMRAGLGINLVEIEKARGLRERPTNPDAFDLILRARALYNQPPSLQRHLEAQALFERALSLDPSSVSALSWVVLCLIERADTGDGWGNLETMQRAERLVAQALAIAPEARETLGAAFQWLRTLGRCEEAIPVAQQLIQRFPNYALGYAYLGSCEILTGHAEEDLPLEQKAIQLNPRDPNLFLRYRRMGLASLLLGQDQNAITFLEHSLAVQGDYVGTKHWVYRQLAAAYAGTGRLEEARHYLSEADQLWPFDTVRSHFPGDLPNPVYAEQIKALQAALRLAGERDHADEDADFGVPADGMLRNKMAGPTPVNAPGARTIRTAELSSLLDGSHPVVIDTVSNSWGRSIPGAAGLKFSGLGGSFTDAAQDRLRLKLHELTGGDFRRPVVVVGWNSERFDGWNLTLRLVALGYTNVLWYRGGREAWELHGLPETRLDVQDW